MTEDEEAERIIEKLKTSPLSIIRTEINSPSRKIDVSWSIRKEGETIIIEKKKDNEQTS